MTPEKHLIVTITGVGGVTVGTAWLLSHRIPPRRKQGPFQTAPNYPPLPCPVLTAPTDTQAHDHWALKTPRQVPGVTGQGQDNPLLSLYGQMLSQALRVGSEANTPDRHSNKKITDSKQPICPAVVFIISVPCRADIRVCALRTRVPQFRVRGLSSAHSSLHGRRQEGPSWDAPATSLPTRQSWEAAPAPQCPGKPRAER